VPLDQARQQRDRDAVLALVHAVAGKVGVDLVAQQRVVAAVAQLAGAADRVFGLRRGAPGIGACQSVGAPGTQPPFFGSGFALAIQRGLQQLGGVGDGAGHGGHRAGGQHQVQVIDSARMLAVPRDRG
jgi:hypothetical protein